MANAKPTLESTVTRFRREAARQDGSSPELEVRLQEVDYANFATIYAALLAKREPASAAPPQASGKSGQKLNLGDGRLTQVVSAIMDVRQARGEGLQRHLRPMRIREIYFAAGKKSHERFVYKEPLVLPVRVSTSGISYIVALSSERADDQGFSSDAGAVIRVKARVSFPLYLTGTSELKPELEWRVDMTVTRQISGSDAESALSQIVGQMFRTAPAMTPANFLAVLRLDDDEAPAARQLYRYEVEAEFMGPEEVRDAIRPADVSAAADTILRLANPEYVREAALQGEVYRIAQYVIKAPGYLRRFQNELGLKRLLPQALAITRADYRAIYPPKGMYLTDKADGKRAVAVVHDGKGCVVSDVLYEFAPPPSGPASAKAGKAGAEAQQTRYLNDTIVDGELIVSEDGRKTAFYGFDVIAVAGEDLTRDGFEKRLARLEEATEVLRGVGVPAATKPYTHIVTEEPRELEQVVRGVYEARRPYSMDGLIFVEVGKPYDETANYKWKSARDNTIDFLARRAPSSALGKAPFIDRPGHKLYFLFVGITPELYDALGLQWCPGYADLFGTTGPLARGRRGGAEPRGDSHRMDANTGSYFPIQFSPSDAPLAYLYQHPDASPLGEIDGKVVEGRCLGDCLAAGGGAPLVDWEMVRIREDRRRELLSKRYYGNDYYAAELIWLNYVDPFPIEQLWEGPSLDYFMRPKAGVYRAQTAVISFVKTQRILSLKHAGWVVDIGPGKGQDLGRYLEAEVQHLVAVDRDRAALAELVRRKYSFARRPGDRRGRPAEPDGEYSRARGAKTRTATTIHVLVADAAEPHTQTLNKLETLGLQRASADAVVCNLAVHYFLGSVEGMRNFVALTRGAVKIGGQVIITLLLGDAVHALFTTEGVPEGGTWDARESEALKYSLKRLYASETLEAAGQRIGVLLPFSDGRYYEEYLVNTKALVAEFAARGLSLLAATNAERAIPEFEARNRSLAALLTPADRKYLSLYGELVFQRDK